ncbi:CvpA family protein [Xylanibacillus composti]|uniref:CvpA family protein n=1 Tax=Xylanibacillus composti TaxID=1572762 RepID=A0A8J4H8E8_9BACL|nr:CvpA family protein [Xylanibacillus composti]MDT9724674.1 CvpA family protein [Xylanibacillus composti]GIQ70959.1 hypothetical protein XYCOK13_37830 [Xylanibacillus composti]
MNGWSDWNVLDWTIAAIGLAALVYGYKNGLVRQLVSLAGLVAAYAAAFFFYEEVAKWLPPLIPYPDFADERLAFLSQLANVESYFYRTLAFALLFFGTRMALGVVGSMLDIAAGLPVISFFNRWGGVLLAGLEAVVLITVAVNVMSILPYEAPQRWLDGSLLAPWFLDSVLGFASKLHELWTEAGRA